MKPAELRDPTEQELNSPLFNAVWEAIKKWDVSRENNGLYSGPTGTDVCIILDAIKQPIKSIQLDARNSALREAAEVASNYDGKGMDSRNYYDQGGDASLTRKEIEQSILSLITDEKGMK